MREEQRSQPRGPQRAFPSALGWERGCIAGRMQPEFHHGLLSHILNVGGFSDQVVELVAELQLEAQ